MVAPFVYRWAFTKLRKKLEGFIKNMQNIRVSTQKRTIVVTISNAVSNNQLMRLEDTVA